MISLTLAIITFITVINGAPCKYGETAADGCEERFKRCSEFTSSQTRDYTLIAEDSGTDCMYNSPKLKDTIKRGGKANQYYVQFDSKDNECWGILMEGGECWGGDWNCLGRCGPNCGSWACSNWGRDCLKHDVCSYFFSASGMIFDDHCGDEWAEAQNDWSHCCVWPCARVCKGTGNSC